MLTGRVPCAACRACSTASITSGSSLTVILPCASSSARNCLEAKNM
ncbi:Uncharacterised protein [Vibrio cholerae]|nr:Uncharacterised protein [Vibrio cholerae]CSD06557.1 Uncharacterised protein [Vibrio cholerae]CSD16125.1 Uncharacterised protein [Vibrio cholerae]